MAESEDAGVIDDMRQTSMPFRSGKVSGKGRCHHARQSANTSSVKKAATISSHITPNPPFCGDRNSG
jgi:hypothetical protein